MMKCTDAVREKNYGCKTLLLPYLLCYVVNERNVHVVSEARRMSSRTDEDVVVEHERKKVLVVLLGRGLPLPQNNIRSRLNPFFGWTGVENVPDCNFYRMMH